MSAPCKTLARAAVRLRITGVVQGVGFRPYVYRLAREHGVDGYVRNDAGGVYVAAEAEAGALCRFVEAVRADPPPAARVVSFETEPAALAAFQGFDIRSSARGNAPTVRISPDIATCADCLRELFDPADRRYGYPYINCTNCGPRYSIVLSLPYDRNATTMRDWDLCGDCRREYLDPGDRRFHAQPLACARCGPAYAWLEAPGAPATRGSEAIAVAANALAAGKIVAIKGLGGYHLACDAENGAAVHALRERKYRKERPFAVMVRDLETARAIIALDPATELLLGGSERPIVLARATREFAGVAPDNAELGVMLAYTPLHHLVFAAGAPAALVMTSANRSSEPIAFADDEALATLDGIADGFLIGERPIARRIDDSLVRAASNACTVLRRARGLAPQAVASFPKTAPLLAFGGDLKNALTLVVDGQAFASQHIGDLSHLAAQEAFEAAVRDLCAIYEVEPHAALLVHDAHPSYRSAEFARSLPGVHIPVQHHRAHVASVLAERGCWDEPVIGFAFDGTGYGDDGTIWGGEVFTGSLRSGLERVAHLRPACLPGGDAAARFPLQAAAGFLYDIDSGGRLEGGPFGFPERYAQARRLVGRRIRSFETTSIGRLFDTVAALLGFTREQTFEGQAAMWVEHLARGGSGTAVYPFPFEAGQLDYRPLLQAVIDERAAGRSLAEIARAFHRALAGAVVTVANAVGIERVVVSGGVFQNALLIEFLAAHLEARLWWNSAVPPNDGGLSLGQAAVAASAVRA